MSGNYQKTVVIPAQQAAQAAADLAVRQLAIQQSEEAQAALNAPVIAPPVPSPVSSDSLSQWLFKLRSCESGGNYAENTGNGFYGAYQFTIPTWNHWNTGYARADLAPPGVQDATIIENTLGTAGLVTQNPGCFRSQGLSNYPPR